MPGPLREVLTIIVSPRLRGACNATDAPASPWAPEKVPDRRRIRVFFCRSHRASAFWRSAFNRPTQTKGKDRIRKLLKRRFAVGLLLSLNLLLFSGLSEAKTWHAADD
jgi:hypothetical protein